MKVYIAGPMRGIKYYNRDAFIKAEEYLKYLEHEVVSPIRIGEEMGLDFFKLPEDFDYNSKELPFGLKLEDIMKRDLEELAKCDAIYLLEGWEDSDGAQVEYAEAKKLDLRIFMQYKPDEEKAFQSLFDEAKQIVQARGTAYGSAKDDFAKTAKMWSGLLLHKLKDGVEITPEDVGWMMVLVKASRNQNKRKRDNYIDAIGYIECAWNT